MDEPTSALTAKEIDELFRIIRRLKDSGCGIVYISHRLEELQHIVDRVTIMRDGQYITSMNFADTTMADIITNMVGREIKEQFPRVECQKGEKIFEVKHLNAGRMVRDISFSLYAGEIVGFAGLMGAGRTETTRAIFGADPRFNIARTGRLPGHAVQRPVFFNEPELLLHLGQRLFRLAQRIVDGLARYAEALRDFGKRKVLLQTQAQHFMLAVGEHRAVKIQQTHQFDIMRRFHTRSLPRFRLYSETA